MSKIRGAAAAGVAAMATAGVVVGSTGVLASTPVHYTRFSMVRSTAATASARCLPRATAAVSIRSTGPTETMRVIASGLPASKEFDLFVIQVPNAPFGLSWYQGDLETDSHGRADGTFVGRFSTETFAVAPNVAPAPVLHAGKDAASNPAFKPLHTFHLGLWFNSPRDAVAAGCSGATTPFNGDHTAGIQALSTRNFPAARGPLSAIRP